MNHRPRLSSADEAGRLLRVIAGHVRRRIPRLRRVVVPYDGGRSRIIADLATAHGMRLYQRDVPESDIELIRTIVNRGDIVVDGGANIGLFTLVVARRVGPDGKVFSFEPSPPAIAELRENLALNDFPWVELVPRALAESSGTEEMVCCTGDAIGLSSFAPPDDVDGVRYRVGTVALDEFLETHPAASPSLIKLDLEGAELRALHGASRIIARASPDLLIEVEPEHLGRQHAAVSELIGLLRGWGYHLYRAGWDRSGKLTLTRSTDPYQRGHGPNLFASTDPSRIQGTGVTLC